MMTIIYLAEQEGLMTK